MSREIKFRAWDKKHKQYVKVLKIYFGANGHILGAQVEDYDTNFAFELQAAQFVLEPSTGLKDKNGEELFEGDVVKYLDACCHLVIAKVRRFERFDMDDEGETSIIAGFMLCDGMIEDVSDGELSKAIDELKDSFEIIGNVHENPELLGGEE